jgi:hypothetical protein
VLNDVDISELEIPTKNGSQTLSAMILDLASGYRGFQGITEENIDFDKFEDFAKLFLVEMIDNSNVAKEGITGIGITPEQIYDFIESNENTIVDLLRSSGYDGNIPIRENKEPLIKELKKKIGNDGINVAKLLDQIDKTGQINVYVSLVESVFSITSIFLAWLIVGLLALLLLPVNIKFFGAYLRSLGIPMILAGATVSVSTLAGSLLIELLPIDKDSIKLIVSSVINGISKQINELSITILIIGVMITTLSIVVSIIQRKQNA